MSAPTHSARRYGPAAVEDDLRRFFNLTLTLARTDFKLRYFGSVLGYVWSLVRPLLMFTVLYVVFTYLFKVNKPGVKHYPVYLLSSIVLWTFFVETTAGSVQCLLAREGLLRKMRFPRMVIPLSVALLALFNLGMNMIPVFVFALATGVQPTLSWLELPVLILIMGMLAVGTGMLLSALYVRFRDIQPIWDVAQQLLFYGSPIIYTILQYQGHPLIYQHLTMCNPIAAILTQSGYSFVHAIPHGSAYYIGGAVRLLIPLGIIAAMFAIGLWFFNREAPRIAENL